MKGGALLLAAATVVVVAAIVAGIVVLGSPAQERARRLDQKRIFDLQQVSNAVDYYHRQYKRLPASLDELASLSNVSVSVRDPITSLPYELRVVSDTAYELCATFDLDSKGEPGYGDAFWAHRAGRQCFRRTVQ
ncbi:MAG TPA: hypothetical protein VKB50_00850 [Vicinamibacterales bacterium]|nr:hypothetical protein [Vicinamibacterales bacterium]